jgi:hypothetical protein
VHLWFETRFPDDFFRKLFSRAARADKFAGFSP